MAFAPIFQRPFSATFDRRAAVAAAPWWLSGGVAAANAIAAYQPKGAASLAASYSNLANPGTYSAAPGTAPSFDTATGWTFAAASSQYLTTGYTPPAASSFLIRFSDRANNGYLGGAAGATGLWTVSPARSAGGVRYWHGAIYKDVLPTLDTGVVGIAGSTAYRNGSSDGAIGGTWDATTAAFIIGAYNQGGLQNYFSGSIQALAIYNATLTSTQVGLISTAMAAL